MTDTVERLETRISWWKPTQNNASYTPAQKGDEEIAFCEIEVFGRRNTAIKIRRNNREMRQFEFEVDNILRVMDASYQQGRRRQAACIRSAINPRIIK